MSDLDAYRSAQMLIVRYGLAAELHASLQADVMEAADDKQALRAWTRILAALDELVRTGRRAGEALH